MGFVFLLFLSDFWELRKDDCNTFYPHRKMMPSCQTRMTLCMRSSGASITKEIFIFSNPRISCRAQMRARAHPDMVTVMKALLELWHSKQVPCDMFTELFWFGLVVLWCGRKYHLQGLDMDISTPLIYVDSLHRRPPWSRWTNISELFNKGSPCHLMTLEI